MTESYNLRRRQKDFLLRRYGGSDDVPEGGESMFLADAAADALSPQDARLEVDTNYADDLYLRVVNRDLDAREDAEWMSKRGVRIDVPSGRLRIGSWFPDHSEPEHPYIHPPFYVDFEVEPGSYVVTLYTYFERLLNTEGFVELMTLEALRERFPPPGPWFRETRPGEMFPPWLYALCTQKPALDPGHESEWKACEHLRDLREQISCVLHLSTEGEPTTPVERRPSKFPLGLRAGSVFGI